LEFVVTNTADVTITVGGSLNFHIGANEGQTMNVTINAMDAQNLGVAALDVTTTLGAEDAIATIDSAVQEVSAARSKLGAYQNRLEHTINNLGAASENLTTAESRIRDVDMAKEMMEFTKYNILQQAATAMLAQANMQPQSVLQLLQ
jgi:flagellin